MPLDLPPPLPPQQAEVVTLEQRHAGAQASGDVITLTVGQYTLLVSGNTYLTEQRIRDVTGAGRTPSQVVLLLNALYAAEGYPLVNVQYAREGQSETIYVHVNEGYLAEVDAPPSITPFFEHFEGRRDLKEADFEAMRVLAELKSERAGYNMSASYNVRESDPAAFTLVIDGQKDPEHDPFNLTAAFGNPGNRFLGRYFGLVNGKYSLPNGDRIGLGYSHGFTGIGTDRGGEDYDRVDLSYSTVNSYGLYGFSAAYTEYAVSGLFESGPITSGNTQFTFEDDREEAEIIDVKLTGNQLLYARDDSRWLLEQELGYIDSTIDITQGRLVATTNNGDAGNQTGADPLDVLLGENTLLGGILGGLIDPAAPGQGGGQTQPGAGNTTSESSSLAGQSIQDERYATARLGTSYSDGWRLGDRRGSLNLGLGYKQGFAGDIDNPLTDSERSDEFGLFDASASAKYRLPLEMLVSLDIKTQVSVNDRVPQQQQWVLGGPDNLSAFLPGILVGDTGAYGRLQLQLARWQFFSRPIRFSLFAEHGMAQFEGDNKPLGRQETQRASDAGIKLEFAPFDWLQLTVHAAEGFSESGLSDETINDLESDIYFNLRGEF